MRKTKLIAAMTVTLISSGAFATNGMNMAGYGAISTAMGGTAQAYNNGLGGMMNNPATMGMGAVEGNKIQVGVGMLGPDVNSSMSTMGIDQDSDGTAYLMPGFGYATKKDGLTWGVGILGQGGMGTEYGKATGNSDLFAGGASMMNNMQTNPNFDPQTDGIALSGEENRSELSVGRIILPVNMEVSDKLIVGASLDFVWAGLDMQMDMMGQQFANLAYDDFATANQTLSGNVSGSILTGLMAQADFQNGDDINYARFNFSDGSDYTGQAKGSGFGAKLGFTYQVNSQLSIGGSYHSKTNMSDLSGDATMTIDADIANFGGAINVPLEGEIKVRDFQWPSTIAMGMSFKPNKQWMFNADFKHINWSETMESFNMTFIADTTQNTPLAQGFAGYSMDVSLPQNWEDQNIVMLGTEYRYNDQLAVRAGANIASNPIPDADVNPLFPATTEKHYMLGFGYNFDKEQSIDFSLTHAPEVTVTGSGTLNNGLEISHSQTNWQLLYTYKWGVVRK